MIKVIYLPIYEKFVWVFIIQELLLIQIKPIRLITQTFTLYAIDKLSSSIQFISIFLIEICNEMFCCI